MSLLSLTKDGVSLLIDENDIVRVYSLSGLVKVEYFKANEGVLDTITVSESLATIDAASDVLIELTKDGVAFLLNYTNIRQVLTEGSGSKVIYEKLQTQTVVVDETPTQINALINTETTLTSFSLEIAQADVRLLNTSNGGYGYELLPPPGVGKAYVISNPIYKWIATGGSFTSADLWLYYKNENDATFLSTINGAVVTPATFLEVPYYNNIGTTGGGSDGLYPSDNIGIHLYASVQQASFEGSLIITFDYKIVDFN